MAKKNKKRVMTLFGEPAVTAPKKPKIVVKKTKGINKSKVKILSDQPKSILGPKTKIVVKEKMKKKGNELFTFINMMFTNQRSFDKTTIYQRGKFAFMIQRYMSIMYPIEACMLDRIGITQGEVVSFWQMMVGRAHSKQPNWMWTKINRKKEEKHYEPPKEVSLLYRKLHEIDIKTYEESWNRFPIEMEKEIKELEEIIK